VAADIDGDRSRQHSGAGLRLAYDRIGAEAAMERAPDHGVPPAICVFRPSTGFPLRWRGSSEAPGAT
jgi:hypothetical protein